MTETLHPIEAAENTLFEKWRAISPLVVRDGATNAWAYANAQVKVLLVLKEVNDPGGGGWDLRNVLREGKRTQTWTNVARWMRGINAMPADLSWSTLRTISVSDRQNLLTPIAVMNLKKIPGGHTANGNEVAAAAATDAELLTEQFAIYNADIVIFCGTSGPGVRALFPDRTLHWDTTPRGERFAEYQSGKYLIDFSHPEARCPSQFKVYGLLDAVRHILKPQ